MARRGKRRTIRKNKSGKKRAPQSQGLAVVALLLNLLILPGFGSLIGGKIKEGIWQIVILFGGIILGLILTFSNFSVPQGVLILFLAPIAAWIWGVFTGISLIKENND